MTTLTYLGHACFLFETEKAAIVIDPWLSGKGAFLGTWRQLPPNSHATGWLVEKMKSKPVTVYVTHEHEDHYDEETLKTLLPHAAGLYIPRYENTFLKKLIEKNLHTTPTLLDENDLQKFHDIFFKIFIDESGINRDSAIFLKTRDLSFLDTNDCKIYDRVQWIKNACGPIDVLSTQFSGAIMHPICYDMTAEEYKKVSRQKRMRKFVAVRNFIRDLAPACYVPSAGPAIFAMKMHEELNFEQESIFPKWWEFRDYLAEKKETVDFKPLDVLGTVQRITGGTLSFSKIASPLSEQELRAIIDQYRAFDQTLPAETLPSWEETISFFEREMNKKLEIVKKDAYTKFGSTVYLQITDPAAETVFYKIDPAKLALEKTSKEEIHEPYYLHTTTAELLGKLMLSGKGWGTYFLSFQFRNKRAPDVFDSALSNFFVANDADDLAFGLRKLTEYKESAEYITLTAPDGKTSVTCKRFCPHQGADLTYAQFDGKHITCPRHQWKFDCANGGKCDTSDDTIDARIKKQDVA